jgi:7-cyano-7-deazaguanine synthase
MKKSIVLLSGGLDSVINFKKAFDESDLAFILTFDYGQAAKNNEIEAAKLISQKFNVKLELVKLDFLDKLNENLKNNILNFNTLKFDDKEYLLQTARSVWIPNRNALFINIAASFAEKYKIDYIITGFNKEEGKSFPDNTKKFLVKVNKCLEFSTIFHPRVKCYTIDMTKNEIVRLGIKIKAPFEYIWSCYRGGSKMCGKCESCQRLKRALKMNNFYDEFCKVNIWGFEE